MNEKTALRFVKALRKEIEAITLHARVSIESGICIDNEPDGEGDGYQKWELAVNFVFFSGWPTSKNDPEKFAFAEMPLSHSLLDPLRDRAVSVKWWDISRLPDIIGRLAAEALDYQEFKVRLIPTDQVLAAGFSGGSDWRHRHVDDLETWEFPQVTDCLEVCNQYGAIPILLGEWSLEEVFRDEILNRLKRAVAQK
jgi:hypothetical protein